MIGENILNKTINELINKKDNIILNEIEDLLYGDIEKELTTRDIEKLEVYRKGIRKIYRIIDVLEKNREKIQK